MNKSAIVYGPQGCGKSRMAERIRKHFGLDRVIDNVDSCDLNHVKWIPAGVLYLVTAEANPVPDMRRVMAFTTVMEHINATRLAARQAQ